jgi:WD40 repeat protein/Ethanolamine utilization protein EutJ (predicted chaperonin)
MMWLGIDFGTCYSSAAFIRHGVLTPVKFGANITSMPSSVCLDKGGKLLVGKGAENKRQLDPSRYRREFKREFGNSTPYTIGDREFLPEELVTELLRRLKSEADVQSPDGQSFSGAVITVPANYQKGKRELMIEAGRAAGFASVLLLDEPVAAAVYHASQSGQSHDGETILVYDLGGGTFDAALIRKEGDAYVPLGLSVGHDRLGGIDFDRKIFEDLLARCSSALRDILTGQETAGDESRLTRLRARQFVADECRELKHHLSEDEEQTLTFPYAPLDEYTLTRAEFEGMIAPLIAETCDICRRLVSETRIEWGQVTRILLVGGSCRIPYVRHALERELKRPALRVDDPEMAVCLGAALWKRAGVAHTTSTIKSEASDGAGPVSSQEMRRGDDEASKTGEGKLGAVKWLGLKKGEHLTFLPEGNYTSTARLALSPDRKRLARALDARVELWDVTGEQLLYVLEEDWVDIKWVGFSTDGADLLVQAQTRKSYRGLETFQVSSGKFLRCNTAINSKVMEPSPDSKYLAMRTWGWGNEWSSTRSRADGIILYSIQSNLILRTIITGDETPVCAFSPDSQLFASASCERHSYSITIWNIANGTSRELDKEAIRSPSGGYITALCFSPDGHRLAASLYHSCLLRDVATGEVLWRTWDSEHAGPYHLKFSPDGKLLALLEGLELKVFESASGRLLHTKHVASASYPGLLSFWPNDETLAFPGKNGTLTLWRLP